jgi:flagellin-specific chaperone FliS
MPTAANPSVPSEQELLGASPLRLMVMAYDVAIQACEQKNAARAIQAISLLRESLNFDSGEAAMGLFRLYQWALECIANDNYPETLKVLRELREAWAIVEQRETPGAVGG